jgi:iron complex outermembrane receptor protein
VEQLFGWNGFGGVISNSLIKVDSQSYSVFGDVSYNLTEKLRLIGGLRWTRDDKEFSFDFDRPANNALSGPPFFIPGSMELITFDNDWSEVTPRAVVEYAFGDLGDVISDGMVYVSAAKGYKGGGYSAISIVTTEAVGVYEPDINWTYELGLKADWWDSRVRTNLAYFYSQIDDVQQNSTNPLGLGLEFPVGNIADATIQGLEFEISFVPTDGLTLFAVGTVAMQGEYSNINPLGAAALAPGLYGVDAKTPQTPDYAVTIGFDYRVDLPGELLGDLSFGADYYDIDDYVTSATNDFYNTGWNQYNAYIGLEIADNFDLKLAAKNLGDDDNITSGSRGLGGFVVQPPLEVLLTVNYRL